MEAKEYIENKEKAKELLKDLANDIGLCSYGGQDYEIIDNPELLWYHKGDADYLRFPYAIRWFMRDSDKYFGKEYSEILTVNEDLDGLQWSYEDYYIDINDPSWLFIGYSNKLEDKIKHLEIELKGALRNDDTKLR